MKNKIKIRVCKLLFNLAFLIDKKMTCSMSENKLCKCKGKICIELSAMSEIEKYRVTDNKFYNQAVRYCQKQNIKVLKNRIPDYVEHEILDKPDSDKIYVNTLIKIYTTL